MLALSASCRSHPSSLVSEAAERPVVLLGLRENRLIRWPSIAVRSDTVFVAANVFPISGDSLDARPALLGRLRQNSAGDLVALAPLDLPPGDFEFGYPRIIAAGRSLHLVWAEFGSPTRTVAARIAVSTFPTSLWHAVLENGAWSVPERIATSTWFGWNSETGDVAIDARGTLHVAVWKGDSAPLVYDFRLVGGRWETSRFQGSGLNHSTAIVTRGDTVAIGFVDMVSDTERVLVAESTDDGMHWTNPIVASRRPWGRRHGSVSRLAVAATADGQVLAIGEKPDDSFYLDTIRVVRMKGATDRSTTQLLVPPPTSDGFVLAGAPCGPIVMLIQTFSRTPQLFELTLPRDSLATTIRPLLSTAGFASFPGVAAGRRSAIAVFAYNADTDAPVRSVAMSLHVCSP
jgi:hypothetical protein